MQRPARAAVWDDVSSLLIFVQLRRKRRGAEIERDLGLENE